MSNLNQKNEVFSELGKTMIHDINESLSQIFLSLESIESELLMDTDDIDLESITNNYFLVKKIIQSFSEKINNLDNIFNDEVEKITIDQLDSVFDEIKFVFLKRIKNEEIDINYENRIINNNKLEINKQEIFYIYYYIINQLIKSGQDQIDVKIYEEAENIYFSFNKDIENLNIFELQKIIKNRSNLTLLKEKSNLLVKLYNEKR